MKLSILIFFILVTQSALAKAKLVVDCSHLQEVSESQFVLFNKKEFIELGECLAVYNIKKNTVNELPKLCEEVIENNNNPFGIMSLSKLEAIYIGQCLGTINYIHQRYNNELVGEDRNSYSFYRNKKYICKKGIKAVNLLITKVDNSMSRDDIKNVLCDVY